MPSELGFEPRSPIYGRFSVLGLVDTKCAQFGPFLVIFWSFLGNIVGLEGNKGCFVTRESRRTCIVRTVFLRLFVLTRFRGRFGPKKDVLGHKMCCFVRALPDLAPQPGGATGDFLPQNLDLARGPPRLLGG